MNKISARSRKLILIYSIAHFLVDMGCAMLIFSISRDLFSTEWVFLFILGYDFIAFVMQLPFGLMMDLVTARSGKSPGALSAGIGAGLVGTGCVLMHFIPQSLPAEIILVCIAGFGNALFHSGAGVDVLRASSGKTFLPGLFVSTGAIGLFLGTKASSYGYDKLLIMAIPLLTVFTMLILMRRTSHAIIDDAPSEKYPSKLIPVSIAAIFTLVIMYRSYLGFVMKYTWRSTFVLGLLSAICIAAGKILGGLIADKAGWKTTMLVSLSICAVCAAFSENIAAFGLVTLLTFNMTMPITMVGLANIMKPYKGIAFGINTTALFIGYVISLFTGSNIGAWKLAVSIAVSAVILLAAIFLYDRKNKDA